MQGDHALSQTAVLHLNERVHFLLLAGVKQLRLSILFNSIYVAARTKTQTKTWTVLQGPELMLQQLKIIIDMPAEVSNTQQKTEV